MLKMSILILWAALVGLSMEQMYPSTTDRPKTTVPASVACQYYYTLSQAERSVDNLLNDTSTICDSFRFAEGNWYRFDSNVTGGKMPEYCVPDGSCGTHIPIWMNGTHPTAADTGPKSVRVCGNMYMVDKDPEDCCGWSEEILVQYCPPKDYETAPYYVYQLINPPECEYAYCTTEACEPGYIRNMENECVDIDECLGNPCAQYGDAFCENTAGSYGCIADDSGLWMTTAMTTHSDFDSCDDMPCLNGYCQYAYYEGAYCVCEYGYTGTYCETYVWSPCFYNPCGPGECHDIDDGTFVCDCPFGLSGPNCSVMDCAASPCFYGTCADLGTDMSYCVCEWGYTGVLCETSIYTNNSISTTSYPSATPPCVCYNGGYCVQSYSVEYCQCRQGYTGLQCESALPSNCGSVTCYNGGSCIHDYYEGYHCSCQYGRYGDYCQYRDDFTTAVSTDYPWSEPTPPWTSPSSYSCIDYQCHNGGSCLTRDGMNFFCVCRANYTGPFCENSIETAYGTCDYNPCQNGGSCFNLQSGGYKCLCPHDQMGYHCQNPPSGNDPCRNAYCDHGSCLAGMWSDDYTCLCDAGYTGTNCNMPLDDNCDCVHGECSWYHYNYAYQDWDFPSNFTDYYYDWAPTTTTSMPWVPTASQPLQCACEPGFTGYYCDTELMSCYDSPCRNGGTCYDQYSSFYCDCSLYFEGDYCEQGIWGDWYESDSCSHECGGGYRTKTRYCLAGYGRCEGRSVDHVPCNQQPCGEDEHPAVDVEIAIDDAPQVTANEELVPQIIAQIINMFCQSDVDECCQYFGYSARGRFSSPSLVTADQCTMNYGEFDSYSFMVRVSAFTTRSMLSVFCDVDKRDRYGDEDDAIFLGSDILETAIEDNINTIEQMTEVDVLGVEPAALAQVGDDDDEMEDDDEEDPRSLALIVGLSVALGFLGLIVLAGIGILLCKKCSQPKRSSHPISQGQPVPTVAATAAPQQMYRQPATPQNLFLASGGNGMPPPYQQVVMYPAAATGAPQPLYGAGLQNPMYGTPLVRNGALPPIEKAVETSKPPQPKEESEVLNNNPAPPSATVYHFQAPPPGQPAPGRLPPIQKA